MAKLLLNLRGVPDDEADEIRALLEEQHIAFYETPPNRWGVSAGGIWIQNQEDVATCERLMAAYQVERRDRARAEYRAAQREGAARTVWTSFRDQPLPVIAAVLGIVLVIVLLLSPFLLLRR